MGNTDLKPDLLLNSMQQLNSFLKTIIAKHNKLYQLKITFITTNCCRCEQLTVVMANVAR